MELVRHALLSAPEADDLYRLNMNQGGDWVAEYDYVDCKVLVEMVRRFGASKVVEVGTKHGWSTALIQLALSGVDKPTHMSFELDARCGLIIEDNMRAHGLTFRNWSFTGGDFRQTSRSRDLSDTDLLFIDADHSEQFAEFYIKQFPLPGKLVRPGGLIQIHDVYPPAADKPSRDADPFCNSNSECWYVTNWLEANRDRFDVLYVLDMCRRPELESVLNATAGKLKGDQLKYNSALWLVERNSLD